MGDRERWSRLSTLIGSAAMLVGAVDPMEGSVLILLGSGLVLLGAWMDRSDRRLVIYRLWTCVLITVGVCALWAISAVGGVGGPHGHSMWWGVLILPYLVGWLMPFWGPRMSRWYLSLGIVVGLWYLTIAAMSVLRSGTGHRAVDGGNGPLVVIGGVGVIAIAGCVRGLRRQTDRATV
jgi:hypothetical protein